MPPISRLILFASSYSPLMYLWAGLLWCNGSKTDLEIATAVGMCIAATGSLIFVVAWFLRAKQIAPTQLKPASVENRDGEAMSYLVSYVIPFLGTEDAQFCDLLVKLVIFAILGLLYISSNMICINPVFILFGLHVYSVVSESGKRFMVISRREHMPASGTLRVRQITNVVAIEVNEDDDTGATVDSGTG